MPPTLVLIKLTNHIQLGHLYEHLYCKAVDSTLFKQSLFAFLDYTLTAKTYHGGIITVEFIPYTRKARDAMAVMPDVSVGLSDEDIYTAITQIMAEIERPFGGKGIEKIRQALEELQNEPWQHIDDFEYLDTTNVRRKAGPFYIAEGKARKSKKLKAHITIEGAVERRLLPLYRQLCLLINANLQHVLADKFGFFTYEDFMVIKSKSAAFTNIYNVAYGEEIDLTAVAEACKDTMDTLRNSGAFYRLVQQLANTSYTDSYYTSPGLQGNYEATLIAIGSKGWQSIATTVNADTLLSHVNMKLELGKEAYRL